MRDDFDELVGPGDLEPGERDLLRRVHDLIVAAGPDPAYAPLPAPRPRRARAGRAALIAACVAVTIAASAGGTLAYLLAADRGPAATHAAALPRQGVLVHGESLAGVELGDTEADVRALWGRHFTVCEGCETTTWFYIYDTGNPLGAAVKFRHGRVTAVFTLGSPRGWRTDKGLRVGQLLEPNRAEPNTILSGCMGYGAQSSREGDTVTSILTQGLAVYGFALTRPSEPVCQ